MRLNFSIRQRILLGFLILTVMVVLTSLGGVWLSISAEQADRSVRLSLQELNDVDRLEKEWQAAAETVDRIFLTRTTAGLAEQATNRLLVFHQDLARLQQRQLGLAEDARKQNTTIMAALAITSRELEKNIVEIVNLGQAEKWAIARDLRETVLTTLQQNLYKNLDLLRVNIEEDVNDVYTAAAAQRRLARLLWIGAAVLAALLGLLLTVFYTRTIVRPIHELTNAVRRVTTRDFSPVHPEPRRDELGELWQAFAMMTDWLRESYENLESRVISRTRDLERRSTQMQVAAEVARDASSVRSLEALLANAVELIRGRFGFYHAGIFLVDERQEFAMLRAATGEAGRKMLAAGHRLKIGEVGIVGYVTSTGSPRIALDVGEDVTHFKNPLLPATRSEMALPLKIGEKVIGALDVQSQFPDAFNQDDVSALQILGDQLAVAIENARLISDYAESLRELETVYLRMSRSAWNDIKRSRVTSGYLYDMYGLQPIANERAAGSRPHSLVAAENMHKVLIPLQVRGGKIGQLEIWLEASQYNPEVENFLQQLGPRLSQSLETARLYQETQDRATRDRLVSELSSRMRETLDIDSVVKTAAAEIRSALGLHDLTIRLEPSLPNPVPRPPERTEEPGPPAGSQNNGRRSRVNGAGEAGE